MKWAVLVLCVGCALVAVVVFAQGDRDRSFVSTQRFEDYINAHVREHQLESNAIELARRGVEANLTGTVQQRNLQIQGLEERLRTLEQSQASQEAVGRTWMISIGVFFTVLQVVLHRGGIGRRPRR